MFVQGKDWQWWELCIVGAGALVAFTIAGTLWSIGVLAGAKLVMRLMG